MSRTVDELLSNGCDGGGLHALFADEFACALLIPIEDIVPRLNAGWGLPELQRRYQVPRNVIIWWIARLIEDPPKRPRLKRRAVRKAMGI